MSELATEYHPIYDPLIEAFSDQENNRMMVDQQNDYVRRFQNYDDRLSELAKVVDFHGQNVDLVGISSGVGDVSYYAPVIGYNSYIAYQTLSRSYISNQIDSAIAELNALRLLRHGWDGYHGVPPSERSIKDAIEFLIRVRKSAPRPVVSASSEGDIELLWDSGSRFVNLGFGGNGKLDCYAERRDSSGRIKEELMFDDVDFSEVSANMDQVYNWIVSEK